MGKPIVVIGTAHSGTSAISGALRILGVEFPNMDTKWERHSESLEFWEAYYKSPATFSALIDKYQKQYSGHWGFKGHHFTQTVEGASGLFRYMPEETLYCITTRDPWAVAYRRIKPTDEKLTSEEITNRRRSVAMKVAAQYQFLYNMTHSGVVPTKNIHFFPFEWVYKANGPELIIQSLRNFTKIQADPVMVKEAVRYIKPEIGYQSPKPFIQNSKEK
jgi:hypothetical protein